MAKLNGQLFARLALDYFDHPKIAGLSDAAIVAHLEMLVYSRKYLTDGVVPMRIALRFASEVINELASNDPDNPSVSRRDDGGLILYGYEDFQETKEQVESRRRLGRKSAEARWSTDAKGNAERNAKRTAAPNANGNTETETETEKELMVNPDGSTGHASASQSFDEWWSHWPKKVKKAEARAALPKALKAIPLTQLIEATNQWVKAFDATGSDRKFMPGPDQFLKHQRWEDDLTTTQPQQPPTIDPLKDW